MLNVNGEILVILLVIMDKKQLKELGVISKKKKRIKNNNIAWRVKFTL